MKSTSCAPLLLIIFIFIFILLRYPEVLGVKRGRNTDWCATGKYAGASINISVNCDRNVFLDKCDKKHPEYRQEPYVILKCCRGRFRDQVKDGQVIYCTEEPGVPNLNRKREPGTVGYWIPDQHSDNTSLGITAFHVLDSITEYSGIDDEKKFTRYKENCSSGVLRKNNYRYPLKGNGEPECTYVCGIYDNSVDVGVVRCTNHEGNNDQGNERIGCTSFQWPPILHDMVVEEKRELIDVLCEYQLHFLKDKEHLCIFHNGQSSRKERKVGKLSNSTSIKLGIDTDENRIKLRDNAIFVKEVRSDANKSFGLSADALTELSTILADDSEDSEYVTSSSDECIDSDNCLSANNATNNMNTKQNQDNSPGDGENWQSESCLEAGGIPANVSKAESNGGILISLQVDGSKMNRIDQFAEHVEYSSEESEYDACSPDACISGDMDTQKNKDSFLSDSGDEQSEISTEHFSKAIEKVNGINFVDFCKLVPSCESISKDCEFREKTFTAGGDSGCVYFIDWKTKNQLLQKAPIGIHRGVYDEEEESDDEEEESKGEEKESKDEEEQSEDEEKESKDEEEESKEEEEERKDEQGESEDEEGESKGDYEESEDKQIFVSVASPIDASLQKLKEHHHVNLWFPIRD